MTVGPSSEVDLLERVHGFVVAAESNDLTEDDWTTFEQLLRENDDACRLYTKYMDMSALLPAILSAKPEQSAPPPAPVVLDSRQFVFDPVPVMPQTSWYGTVGEFTSSWPFAYMMSALICGIGALIGSVVEVSHPTQFAGQSTASPATPKAIPSSNKQAIGRITAMVDCRFRNGSVVSGQKSESSSQLSPHVSLGDKYALAAGLMEITYDTGAKVVLQGPCTYEVESETGGYLSIGKLTARIEKGPRSKAQGPNSDIQHPISNISNPESPIPSPSLSTLHSPLFTIKTPTATVTDLGTEFGVEVDQQGGTRSHVFVGLVRVAMRASTAMQGQTVELHANDSVVVERKAGAANAELTMHRAVVDPKQFIRSDQVVKAVDQGKLAPLRRWQAHADAIRRDPALVVFYDFQRHEDSPEVLHAAADGVPSKLDGRIEGATWTTGRMTGKQALHFDGDQARVEIGLPGKLTQATLAAWLTIEMITDQDCGCCLLADDWRDGMCRGAWQITRQGEIQFGISAEVPATSPGVLPWQQWGRDRWRHIAVVVDPVAGKRSFFLDGEKVGVAETASDFEATFTSAKIGNWWSLNDRLGRGHQGRIDSLVILGRALTDQEITEMYEAGKK